VTCTSPGEGKPPTDADQPSFGGASPPSCTSRASFRSDSAGRNERARPSNSSRTRLTPRVRPCCPTRLRMSGFTRGWLAHDLPGRNQTSAAGALRPAAVIRIFPASPIVPRAFSYVSVASPCLTRPSGVRREEPRASDGRSLTPDCLPANNSSARRALGPRVRRHLEASIESKPGP
jgi:hypothetical protein